MGIDDGYTEEEIDLINNEQMYYDELYAEKDKLEQQCIEIENQISNSKVKELKDFEWETKAQNALKIKKFQLKKVNRKIEFAKQQRANNRRKTQFINDEIKKRLIKEIGQDEFDKFLNNLKEIDLW